VTEDQLLKDQLQAMIQKASCSIIARICDSEKQAEMFSELAKIQNTLAH
jgi:hypothetical protein